MSKSKKKNLIDLVDEKLGELELRIEKLEKQILQVNKFMSEDMETYASLVWDYIGLSLQRNVDLNSFDYYIEKIKSREKELKEIKTKVNCLGSHELIEIVIEIAKGSTIPFERLAPYLIEKLGKNLAKKLVKKETMLKNYGKEGFKIWETLLKK